MGVWFPFPGVFPIVHYCKPLFKLMELWGILAIIIRWFLIEVA